MLAYAHYASDHTTGKGNSAVTVQLELNKPALEIECTYGPSKSTRAYLSYSVESEELKHMGLEHSFKGFKKNQMVDCTWLPKRDMCNIKYTLALDKENQLTGYFSFHDFSKSNWNKRSDRLELFSRLQSHNTLRIQYDRQLKATKLKLSHQLDRRNTIEGEYSYLSSHRQGGSIGWKHQSNHRNNVNISADWSSRKYLVEWTNKTGDGPWTMKLQVPFQLSLDKTEVLLKRRLEFLQS
eukprot:jgi/Galph1/1994/GphlegSOOS_G666.1